ncbi:MAG: phosphoribosyl transferase [Candidatus Omnitrophica bacterium]|nr:phosphoribosyl transferase [Candidatus Omnitrophota bacterium]
METEKINIISRGSEGFSHRREAGQRLSEYLAQYRDKNPLVLGVPRGGVVIAREIARQLQGELDVTLARKLGSPGNPELAVGAVSENGRVFISERLRGYAEDSYLEEEAAVQRKEIERRIARYRQVRPKVSLEGRLVIVTDDGIATGATMQAALWNAAQEGAQQVIAALPVAPQEGVEKIAQSCDKVYCLLVPPLFSALSQFYADFSQTSDDEVVRILTEDKRF